MFTADEITVTSGATPQTEAGIYAAQIQDAIGSLEAKLSYPPPVRMGILGGVVGSYFGGVAGALAGLGLGWTLGRRRMTVPPCAPCPRRGRASRRAIPLSRC